MLKEIDEDKDIESKSNNSIVCKSNYISCDDDSEKLTAFKENLNK